MPKCPTAENPPWAIPYYKQTEAEAYRLFMTIAHLVGVQYSEDIPVADGWGRYQTLYKPVILSEDTEGSPGPWSVQLADDVSFITPDVAAIDLPFFVQPSLTIYGCHEDDGSEMIRPELCVYVAPQTLPQIHLAHTANLGTYSMEGPLRNQARYITWLTIIEAQVSASQGGVVPRPQLGR